MPNREIPPVRCCSQIDQTPIPTTNINISTGADPKPDLVGEIRRPLAPFTFIHIHIGAGALAQERNATVQFVAILPLDSALRVSDISIDTLLGVV